MLFFCDNLFAAPCINIGADRHCIRLGAAPIPDDLQRN